MTNIISEDLYRVIKDALVTSAYIGNEDWEHDLTGYGEERCLAIRFEYVSDYADFIFRVRDLCPVIEEEWCKGIQLALADVEVYSDNTYAFKHLVTKVQITQTISVKDYK